MDKKENLWAMLRAAIDQVEADAARYRWLAENASRIEAGEGNSLCWTWAEHEYGVRDKTLDSAIDALASLTGPEGAGND